MAATKTDILDADDLPRIKVPTPGWGDGHVWVRALQGHERDAFEVQCLKNGRADMANVRARLSVLVLCDDKGERLFSDSDAVTLGKKSGANLDRIWEAATAHNHLYEKDIEALAKNSEAAQSGDSGSG